MSLVHEALQKAEREKQRKLGTTPSAPVSYSTPQVVPAPVIHTPAAPVSVIHVAREAVSPTPAAPVEETTETNNFLLPILIFCVAVVAIIAIVFLVSNANSVLRPSKENPPVAVTAAPAPVTPSAPSAAAPQPTAPPPTEPATTASVLPPAAPVTDESKYKVSGIMKDPDGKPVAVLNGRVAYEGYFIDGATIKKIDPDRVTLDVKGQEVVLRLF
jgi:hypothetical protein